MHIDRNRTPLFPRFVHAVLAVCLVTTCILTGCSHSASDQMGRYVEEPLTLPDGIGAPITSFRASDGSLVFYAGEAGSGNSHTSRNVLSTDGQLDSINIGWLDQLTADGGWVTDISEGADGMVYVLYASQDGKLSLARSADGKTHENIEIPGWNAGGMITRAGSGSSSKLPLPSGNPVAPSDGTSPSGQGSQAAGKPGSAVIGGGMGRNPMGVVAIEQGFLILYGAQGVTQYDADGTLVREYEGIGQHGLVAVRGNVVVITKADNSGAVLYDLSTGDRTDQLAYEGLGETSCLGLDEEGLFVAGSSGIFRQDGDNWQMIVDGGLTSLMLPTSLTVVSGGAEDYYAWLGGEDFQLLHYTYSADTPAQPSTTLEIFSLHDNNTIRQAMGEFQRLNPDVRVSLQVGMEEDSGATAEDVIRALNTELIAGKGPDLIVLDGLPVDSYIEKGVLKDITALTDDLTGELGLLANLMDTYTVDSKTYGVPSRFGLPVMLGKETQMQALDSLADLVSEVEVGQAATVPLLRAPDSLWKDGGMLMEYYEASVDNWTREDGSIDEAALTAFLAEMLRLDQTLKQYTPQMGKNLMVAAGRKGMGMEIVDTGAWDLRDDRAQVHIQNLTGMMSLQAISSMLGDKPGMTLHSLFDKNKYYPRGGVGVVAAGKQQQLAADFVELLLSPVVQDKYLYDGFPVNSRSLETMIDQTLAEENLSDMGFVELCGQLNHVIFADQVVKDAVQQQIANLLSGAVTPAEAAAKVVENTKLYLAE